jgi:hypothetical protein
MGDTTETSVGKGEEVMEPPDARRKPGKNMSYMVFDIFRPINKVIIGTHDFPELPRYHSGTFRGRVTP